jgi:predicted nucleic acid-binding protein
MAAAWIFEDEATEKTHKALRSLESGRAIVPALWHLEVRNLLLIAERRRRITTGKADELLEWLIRLPIDTDTGADEFANARIFALARAYRLTTYDAAYLELANRLRAPTATLDRDLQLAVRHSGLTLV